MVCLCFLLFTNKRACFQTHTSHLGSLSCRAGLSLIVLGSQIFLVGVIYSRILLLFQLTVWQTLSRTLWTWFFA